MQNENSVLFGLDNKKSYTIVSLVSAQIMPNILFINYMKKRNIVFNKYILVFTEETEGVKNNIKKFLEGEKGNVKEVKINSPFAFIHIKTEIEKELSDTKDIIFNITGGTKIMSCALFDIAKDRKLSNNIFYIDKKIYKTEYTNKVNDKEIEISDDLLNIQEYFTLSIKEGSSFKFKAQSPTENKYKEIKNFTDKVINNRDFLNGIKNFDIDKLKHTLKNEIENRKKQYKLEIPKHKEKEEDKEVLNFITTGWLEEFVYYNIVYNMATAMNNSKSLDENMQYIANNKVKINTKLIIDPNLKIKENFKESNEIDVCFMYENILYLVECKTNLSPNLFNATIYKIKSIHNKLGLFSKAIVITLNRNYPTTKYDIQLLNARKKDEKINIIQLNGTDINLYTTITNMIANQKKQIPS